MKRCDLSGPRRGAKALWRVWAAVAVCGPLLCSQGASFKAASVNLGLGARAEGENGAGSEGRLEKAAAGLKAVQPEVILLEGVRDWKMCRDLVQKLKPGDYQVLVCSSFRDVYEGSPAPAQTAVLARQKGYFSWSAPWQGTGEAVLPGGFAFAAVRMGGRRVGIFSTRTEGPVPREFKRATEPEAVHASAARQILKQVEEVRGWVQNRPEVLIVGGSLDPELKQGARNASYRLLTEGGFRPAPAGTANSACFFYSPGEAISVEAIPAGEGVLAYEVTIDSTGLAGLPSRAGNAAGSWGGVVSNPAAEGAGVRQAGGWPVAASPNPPGEPRGATAPAQLSAPVKPLVAIGAGVGFVLLMGVTVILVFQGRRRRNRRPLLLSQTSGELLTNLNYVVVSSGSSHGGEGQGESDVERTAHTWQQNVVSEEQDRARALVLPHLRRWMKERLFRKLFQDREMMLETQAEAAAKALHVTERLAKIERQIQEQNRIYQLRIDELTRELNAAREESRELLRARIAQVKAEMETSRARLLASAQREEKL